MTPARTVRTVSVRGCQLRIAVRSGNPGVTPLLLLNGIGGGFESFDPFVAALDPAIPVLRVDVPGTGGSPLPLRPYRFRSLCRVLVDLLDDLEYPRVDALGISWGGGLAQQFARTGGERCRRLVLVATGTGAVMVPAHPRVLARMATPRRFVDPRYVRRIAPDIYGGSARQDPELAARLLHQHSRAGSQRGYAYQLLAASGWTSIGFLPKLAQETLVLAGDDDPIIPAANGRLLTRLIPNARLHIYPGGHIELAARPDLLVPVIEDFLRQP